MSLLRLVVALGALVGSAQPRGGAPMTTLDILAYDQPHLRGQAALSAGGQPCQLAWSGRDARLSCALALAPAATEMTLTGELSRESGRRMQKGTMRWQVIDIGPALRHLRDRTRPMGDRFRAFVREKAAFEARHAAVLEGFGLSNAEADSPAAIADAEKRLGFSLPADHRHLLSTVGALIIGDSSMTRAAETRRSYEAVIKDWDTPKADLDKDLSKATRALLEASALLFTQVGDGYGGLLYRPSGEAACGGGPAYYWIHQDGIDEARLLTRHDGTCADYADALMRPLAEDGLQRYEDTEPGVVVVDRSAPGPMRLQLTDDGNGFVFRLRPDWDLFR